MEMEMLTGSGRKEQNFNNPIKVTFPYSSDITVPPLTGIAFQNTDGIWYSSGKFTWDTTNKTVSTETTHFSDWAGLTCCNVLTL